MSVRPPFPLAIVAFTAAAPALAIPPTVFENQVEADGSSTLMAPTAQILDMRIDSGAIVNRSAKASPTWTYRVHVDGAAWMRIWFDDVVLSHGSTLRITSLHDGETQLHDGVSIAQWSETSAYFNGDTIELELISAPGTYADRVQIHSVTYEAGAAARGSCGICGNDDRVPSFENHSGRLSNGCSATIYSTNSCIVTAGHCVSQGQLMLFNVPPSNPDCSTNQPPVADQFPIVDWIYENAGVGDDWGVLLPGVNSEGLLPYEKYGMMIPIASGPAENGDTVETHGYGQDSQCERSGVQQTTSGTINAVNSQDYSWDMDTTYGQSGSNSVHEGQIIAVVTHCSNDNCTNRGTRVDASDFAAARNSLCPGATGACCYQGHCFVIAEANCNAGGGTYLGDNTTCDDSPCATPCPEDVTGDGNVNVSDVLAVIGAWGPCSSCDEDIDGSGSVDVTDLLAVIGAWGPCP